MDAKDKIDLEEATANGFIITASFAFALGIIYFLTYFNIIYFSFLDNIPFIFVAFSLIIVFNLSFSYSMVDQLLD